MIKKLLAVTAVLSVLMCAAHAAALAFTDNAEIGYAEAVSALTEAGIIEGYPDGSFRPHAEVTRAEAAKMIACFSLGPEAARTLEVPEAPLFDDLPAGHWASKYIAWGASEGIIAGMGDGKFSPEAPVTACQMAKLLLEACGFTGNYEGPDWEKNVAADADFIFSGGSGAAGTEPATREEVSLFMNNCLAYRETAGGATGTGGAVSGSEAEAYRAEFAEFRQHMRAMVSETDNLTYSEDGVVLTTVIDTPGHLEDLCSALEWMYLSTFLAVVPEYASSFGGIADIGSTEAYAAALIAYRDELNALLSEVTEIRVSGGGESIIVASGGTGTLSFTPGTSGTSAQRAFDGLGHLLENANLITLGDFETEDKAYRFSVILCAEFGDGSSCEISIPYTFRFVTA